jgi:uroporphyrinogen III methyltransferase/synthase
LTVKAAQLLKSADAVVYDRLVNSSILDYAPENARMIYVGKASSRHTLPQEKINALLVKLALQGNTVVRLKGGDPFVFGRGGEEILELLKHKIEFEVVPGITSAIAVPAYAGIPVTHRGKTSSLGIFTGQEDPEKEDTSIDWQRISTGLGTLVFLMGFENLEKITRTLIRYGRDPHDPCCLIQWGTLPGQRSLAAELKDIVEQSRRQKFSAPAIFIVGDVVSLKDKLDWFEKKPLFGQRVLVTVPSQDSGRLTGLLAQHGAGCEELPLIKIRPLESYRQLDAQLQKVSDFSWLVVSSQNGVRFLQQRLAAAGSDIRALKGVKVAAIGPKTAQAVKDLGISVDLQAKDFTQEGLVRAFGAGIKGKKVLIVRAQEARDVLPDGLKARGASVTVCAAYRTELREPIHDPDGRLRNITLATFTSSSCVEGFFKVFGKRLIRKHRRNFLVASIGPITSQTCRRLGLRVDIEASQYTLDGLVEAIVSYYNSEKREAKSEKPETKDGKDAR